MLKILQARLQQYINRELLDVQTGFRKGSGTRDQIANIHCIKVKAREFQKNIYVYFIDYAKVFDCGSQHTVENSYRDGNTRPPYLPLWTSLMAQMVKCLPTMQETWVQSLGWEDPLEKEMATHSSILAWKTPWTEEPGGLQSMGSHRVGHNRVTSLHFTYLPPEKAVCRSRSNSWNWTWNNRLIENWERSTSRLYIVNLLI